MNKLFTFFLLQAIFFSAQAQQKTENVVLRFNHVANGKPVVLNDSLYTNDKGKKYSISKLKYYISNIEFTGAKNLNSKEVYLVNAQKPNGIKLTSSEEKITGISFMIGVDSLLNCSGAQSGALDPLNDMFWTWNNGYIMFKLEGTSAISKADRNRLEYHIGGYKGEHKTMQRVSLDLSSKYSKKNKSAQTEIDIEVNLDNFWKGVYDLNIAETPVISAPGKTAGLVSQNITRMFSYKKPK